MTARKTAGITAGIPISHQQGLASISRCLGYLNWFIKHRDYPLKQTVAPRFEECLEAAQVGHDAIQHMPGDVILPILVFLVRFRDPFSRPLIALRLVVRSLEKLKIGYTVFAIFQMCNILFGKTFTCGDKEDREQLFSADIYRTWLFCRPCLRERKLKELRSSSRRNSIQSSCTATRPRVSKRSVSGKLMFSSRSTRRIRRELVGSLAYESSLTSNTTRT